MIMKTLTEMDGEVALKAPIAVMSFNRPEFLAPVLESLKAQRGNALEGREIHLFQDGARNRYSKIRYAADADIEASIACFRSHFPEGIVHYSGDNIGIFENFSAAEDYFFLERSFDTAYFFEDDMTLSPVYLEMMAILEKFALNSDNVAYFAAYGDYYASRDEVADHRRDVITLDHHWAFGIVRRHWLKLREALSDYRALVGGQDYARRYHRGIYDYYRQFEAVPRGTSQDAAKAFACARLGLWRCRTFVPFAKYIGTKGAHMTEDAYETLGFSKTVVAQQVIPNLRFPEEREIKRLMAEQTALFAEIYAQELEEMVRTLPARKLNPMRLCTEDDVVEAYRLFLHREPEHTAIIERHAGQTPVFSFVSGLLRSGEFTNIIEADTPPKRPLAPDRLCTAHDVAMGYQFLLHRDPDSEAVIAGYVDKLGVRAFIRSLMGSNEFSEIGQRLAP
jgi:hypothetical protein